MPAVQRRQRNEIEQTHENVDRGKQEKHVAPSAGVAKIYGYAGHSVDGNCSALLSCAFADDGLWAVSENIVPEVLQAVRRKHLPKADSGKACKLAELRERLP